MKRAGIILALWALAILVGFVIESRYVLTVATTAAFFALFSQSWNLQSGFTGYLSVGHSVFIAVPIYVTLVLYQQAGVPLLLSGVAGVLVAVCLAMVIGAITLRLSGPYFALATLSASAVMQGLILHFSELTNGPSGIAIPFADDSPFELQFVNVRPYYIIAVTMLAAITAFVSLARNSKLGYYAASIKSSEAAAAAAGIQVARVKLVVFCLSAAATAIGSVVYVFYIGFADPVFLAGTMLSVEIALIAVIGGLDFLVGPIVGAVFYVLVDAGANAFFGASGGWTTMLLGFSVVLLVLTEPRGICQLIVAVGRAIGGRRDDEQVRKLSLRARTK